jgi:uncharacterized protein (TIGR00369 family)
MTASPSSLESPPAFDPARFIERMGSVGHNGALGIRWHGASDAWVELRLPWCDSLIGDEEARLMASGPIFTLMDNATSLAVWQKMQAFRPQATLDFRIDYIRPAGSGRDVIGRGECYRLTRSIAFVRGIAHDGDADDPVAHCAGTFMFTGPAWTL